MGSNDYGKICRYARRCDPREEPPALARMVGSVRGARGNPGPYRDQGKLSLCSVTAAILIEIRRRNMPFPHRMSFDLWAEKYHAYQYRNPDTLF